MSERANKILYLVFSLLLAIVFWLYVDDKLGSISSKELTSIPIEFIGADDTLPARGLMLADGADTTLDLTVEGPRTVVSGIEKNDIRIQVDLSNATAVERSRIPGTM